MQKRINSRSKGARTEKALITFMEEWSGYEFSRVPASGGLRWRKTDNITGDIICSDDRHRCLISFEVKARKEIDFEKIINLNVNSEILEFWEQARNDGKRGNRIPMLFMRYNQLAPKNFFYVILEYEVLERIFSKMIPLPYVRIFTSDNQELAMITTETLKQVKYRKVHKAVKHLFKKRWPALYKAMIVGL